MPKVVEVLKRIECHGQIWFTTEVIVRSIPEDVNNPQHQEKGVRQSPFQKDNFRIRETE